MIFLCCVYIRMDMTEVGLACPCPSLSRQVAAGAFIGAFTTPFSTEIQWEFRRGDRSTPLFSLCNQWPYLIVGTSTAIDVRVVFLVVSSGFDFSLIMVSKHGHTVWG